MSGSMKGPSTGRGTLAARATRSLRQPARRPKRRITVPRMGRRALAAACAALALGAVSATAAARDFEHPASHDPAQQFAAGSVQRQDTPNDPGYDRSEPDDEDGRSSSNLFDERFDLFGL